MGKTPAAERKQPEDKKKDSSVVSTVSNAAKNALSIYAVSIHQHDTWQLRNTYSHSFAPYHLFRICARVCALVLFVPRGLMAVCKLHCRDGRNILLRLGLRVSFVILFRLSPCDASLFRTGFSLQVKLAIAGLISGFALISVARSRKNAGQSTGTRGGNSPGMTTERLMLASSHTMRVRFDASPHAPLTK